jgi:hypothetical protein
VPLIVDVSVGVAMLSVLFIIVLVSVVMVVELLLSVEVVLAPSLLQATKEHAITAIAKNFFI